MKKSFILKNNWIGIFDRLSDKQAGALIKMLFDYNVNGVTSGSQAGMNDEVVNAYFNMMILDCDDFKESYDRRCETSAGNGRLGGRPRKEENLNKPNSKPKKPNNLSKPDNENENDLNLESSEEDSLSGSDPPDAPETIDYKKFVNWFNSETKGVFGIAKYPLGEKRKASIRARVREHGKQSLFDVVKKAHQSDFLKGDNKSGFTATLDWIIKPSNFEKILSGNYDNKRETGEKTPTIID